MRYLHQDKVLSCNQILRRFPQYSKATICRHMKRPIDHSVFDRRVDNPVRPKELTERDERNIIRAVHHLRISIGSFTTKRLRTEAGIPITTSMWTIRRVLNRHGYPYVQSRRKGMLRHKDAYKRSEFAPRMKRLSPSFWKCCISVYFDRTSFLHKTNPYDQTGAVKSLPWRTRSESLALYCTSKGKKAGIQGKVVHFFVAIAYKKGVICCNKYTQRLNGEFFASYIRNRFPWHFQTSANPREMGFLQDGDPSQNSTRAQRALQDVGALLFRIPAHSLDLNPIENIFNNVSAKLERDALRKQITHETFEQCSDRVEKTLCNTDRKLIDRTIEHEKNCTYHKKKRLPLKILDIKLYLYLLCLNFIFFFYFFQFLLFITHTGRHFDEQGSNKLKALKYLKSWTKLKEKLKK